MAQNLSFLANLRLISYVQRLSQEFSLVLGAAIRFRCDNYCTPTHFNYLLPESTVQLAVVAAAAAASSSSSLLELELLSPAARPIGGSHVVSISCTSSSTSHSAVGYRCRLDIADVFVELERAGSTGQSACLGGPSRKNTNVCVENFEKYLLEWS
jgi:hypothetical protein